MFRDRFRYELRIIGIWVILTPILILFGFALLAGLIYGLGGANTTEIARFLGASLEMMLPLAAGIFIATIVTHDPALELQLTFPRRYDRTALCRLTMITLWVMLVALVTSILLAVLSLWRIPTQVQSWSAPLQVIGGLLTWLAPLFWLVTFGLCVSLLIRSRSAASALLGGLWIGEVILKGMFVTTDWLKPFFLFPTTFAPDVDFWLTNRLELIGMAVLLLVLGWLLLRNTESLLHGATGGE